MNWNLIQLAEITKLYFGSVGLLKRERENKIKKREKGTKTRKQEKKRYKYFFFLSYFDQGLIDRAVNSC